MYVHMYIAPICLAGILYRNWIYMYDSVDFQVSKVLRKGFELSHDCDIGYIIITS